MKDEKRPRPGDAADNEVGYGKPPKHTRFQRGRSGNPRGRPKGTKNLKTDLIEELGERIRVREGEKTRRVSKQRAVLKTLVTRSLQGDARAMNSLLSAMMRVLDAGEAGADAAEPLDAYDLEILEGFRARVRRADANASAEPKGVDTDPEGESS